MATLRCHGILAAHARAGRRWGACRQVDPRFVDRVRDIVELYMAPPDSALVLCVDAKSQMQARDRS